MKALKKPLDSLTLDLKGQESSQKDRQDCPFETAIRRATKKAARKAARTVTKEVAQHTA